MTKQMDGQRENSRWRGRASRAVLLATGMLALVLGLIGIFLPLLPTTPFILLAAWCFARSSRRWHNWLLAHPRMGPVIKQWQRDRSMDRKVRNRALLLVIASFAVTLLLVPLHDHLRWGLMAMATILCIYLWRIPVTEPIGDDDLEALVDERE